MKYVHNDTFCLCTDLLHNYMVNCYIQLGQFIFCNSTCATCGVHTSHVLIIKCGGVYIPLVTREYLIIAGGGNQSQTISACTQDVNSKLVLILKHKFAMSLSDIVL